MLVSKLLISKGTVSVYCSNLLVAKTVKKIFFPSGLKLTSDGELIIPFKLNFCLKIGLTSAKELRVKNKQKIQQGGKKKQ